MKFVTDVKKDYLYKVYENNIAQEIMVVDEIYVKNDLGYNNERILRGRTVDFLKQNEKDFYQYNWNFPIKNLSQHPNESHLLDNVDFVFYEIGHRDDYPEYFV